MLNLSALSSPNFRIYLFAAFFSVNGFWIQKVLLAWLSWELTKSPTFVGLAVFVTFLPTVLFVPIFGVIIDKVNIKKASFYTFFSMILASISLFILSIANLLSPSILLFYCFCIGTISSAHHPVRLSLGPRLVSSKNEFSSVVALSSVNFNASRLLGPAIGGIIIHFYGTDISILVTTICYLPSVIIIPFLKPREVDLSLNYKYSIKKELIEGIKFVISNKTVLSTLLISSFVAFFGRSVLETLPLISEGMFYKGPSGLALLTTSAGIGALIASVLKILFLKQVSPEIKKYIYFILLMIPLNLFFLGISETFFQAIILIGFLGFFVTLVQINMQSGLQIILSDFLRGRIMSFWIMITFGSAAVGSMFLGFISDLFSISASYIFIGLITFILNVFIFFIISLLKKWY